MRIRDVFLSQKLDLQKKKNPNSFEDPAMLCLAAKILLYPLLLNAAHLLATV